MICINHLPNTFWYILIINRNTHQTLFTCVLNSSLFLYRFIILFSYFRSNGSIFLFSYVILFSYSIVYIVPCIYLTYIRITYLAVQFCPLNVPRSEILSRIIRITWKVIIETVTPFSPLLNNNLSSDSVSRDSRFNSSHNLHCSFTTIKKYGLLIYITIQIKVNPDSWKVYQNVNMTLLSHI